jgi:hypothetical protein
MKTSKIKKELSLKLIESLTATLAEVDPKAAVSVEKSTINAAKKLAKKFGQSLKKLEKKAAKIESKLAKKNKAKKKGKHPVEAVGPVAEI